MEIVGSAERQGDLEEVDFHRTHRQQKLVSSVAALCRTAAPSESRRRFGLERFKMIMFCVKNNCTTHAMYSISTH